LRRTGAGARQRCAHLGIDRRRDLQRRTALPPPASLSAAQGPRQARPALLLHPGTGLCLLPAAPRIRLLPAAASPCLSGAGLSGACVLRLSTAPAAAPGVFPASSGLLPLRLPQR